eukprot:Skav225128  [mRNA]  locus=scaffold1056:6372:6962:+ [translate_table: standard]
MFIRSRFFTLLLVKALSKCLRNRRPPRDTVIRAYHGTSQNNAESIRRNGFRPSSEGMLGPGVYISRDLNKVRRYCRHRAGAILELKVEVGTVCIIDKQGHHNQKTWHSSFDTAWVPSRCSMVHSELEEACVAQPCRIQLVRVWPENQLSRLVAHEVLRLFADALTFWPITIPICTEVECSAGKPHNRVRGEKRKQD